MKKIFSIVLIFTLLFCIYEACDHIFESVFYIRNSLSVPITYVTISSNNRQNSMIINPGECKMISTSDEMGGNDFMTNGDDDIVRSFFYSFLDQIVVFSDGTELHWSSNWLINGNISIRELLNDHKHPVYKKYWKMLNKKKRTYEVEYTIDEEDYQTALYLQTQDSLAILNR